MLPLSNKYLIESFFCNNNKYWVLLGRKMIWWKGKFGCFTFIVSSMKDGKVYTLAYTIHPRVAAKPHGRITEKMDHSSGCVLLYISTAPSVFSLGSHVVELIWEKSNRQHQTSPLLSTPSVITNGLLLLDFLQF